MERLNLGKIIGTYDAKFDRSKYILKVNTQIFFKYNNGDTVEMYQDSFEEYVYGPNYNNDLNKILYHFAYGVLYTYLVSDEKASVTVYHEHKEYKNIFIPPFMKSSVAPYNEHDRYISLKHHFKNTLEFKHANNKDEAEKVCNKLFEKDKEVIEKLTKKKQDDLQNMMYDDLYMKSIIMIMFGKLLWQTSNFKITKTTTMGNDIKECIEQLEEYNPNIDPIQFNEYVLQLGHFVTKCKKETIYVDLSKIATDIIEMKRVQSNHTALLSSNTTMLSKLLEHFKI